MKKMMFAAALLCSSAPAFAQGPDGLILPKGFHAKVVADGLGPIRHMALRGNDITRLAKLDRGEYDAIVLAAAGLRRLGLAGRIRCSIELRGQDVRRGI